MKYGFPDMSQCLQPGCSPAAECLSLQKVKLSPDLPQGGFIDTSGRPYLTFKAAKKSVFFVAHWHPGSLLPNRLAKFKWPRVIRACIINSRLSALHGLTTILK